MTIYFSSSDIAIYRRRRRGVTDRYGMSVTLTVVPADIQPSSIERAQLSYGRFGTVWDAYVDSSIDIKENDEVVDTSTGKRYAVKGISTWDGAGLLEHKQLILVSRDG